MTSMEKTSTYTTFVKVDGTRVTDLVYTDPTIRTDEQIELAKAQVRVNGEDGGHVVRKTRYTASLHVGGKRTWLIELFTTRY